MGNDPEKGKVVPADEFKKRRELVDVGRRSLEGVTRDKEREKKKLSQTRKATDRTHEIRAQEERRRAKTEWETVGFLRNAKNRQAIIAEITRSRGELSKLLWITKPPPQTFEFRGGLLSESLTFFSDLGGSIEGKEKEAQLEKFLDREFGNYPKETPKLFRSGSGAWYIAWLLRMDGD